MQWSSAYSGAVHAVEQCMQWSSACSRAVHAVEQCMQCSSALLLLLLKKVGSAILRESGIHPISPKTPATQYQPTDRKERKVKIVEDYSRSIKQLIRPIKKTLALLLIPASPTTSNTGLARSLKRDTERGIKVLRYFEVLQRGSA